MRFIDLDPPRIVITGRTSYTLSAFGEHLIGEEIEDAVSVAAAAIGAAVVDYSVGPVFPRSERDPGGHLFIVEVSGAVPDASRIDSFSRVLDERLCATNADYETHRANEFGLEPPRVCVVEPGTFAAWMKSRGQLGGQHKVPRIINDADLFEELRAFTRCNER